MDLRALKAEIQTDPAVLVYSGKTRKQVADLLNSLTTGRTVQKTSVPVRELFGAIQDGAWPAVGSVAESKLRAILGMQEIDPSNTNIRAMLGSIFPVGGATGVTRTALLALSTRTASRAEEIGVGGVTEGDVIQALDGGY